MPPTQGKQCAFHGFSGGQVLEFSKFFLIYHVSESLQVLDFCNYFIFFCFFLGVCGGVLFVFLGTLDLFLNYRKF